MEALLYFALWAGFIFLMMRLGCGSQVMGHGRASQHPQEGPENAGAQDIRWVPPETDTDPVCGKTVTTTNAKSSVYAGNVFYFCSRDCREVFEAAPDLYVNTGGINQQELEPSHV